METTKEKILTSALNLYVQNGYENTTMRDLAAAVGITAGALYKHYRSKLEIFHAVLRRMEEYDRLYAEKCHLPTAEYAEAPEAYARIKPEDMLSFTLDMFHHWTAEPFPSAFRKMLTQEQFHSPRMAELYQQYFGCGPLRYMTDLFTACGYDMPELTAYRFYGIFYFFLNQYDTAEHPNRTEEKLKEYLSYELRKK